MSQSHSLAQGISCTFVHTKKNLTPQFWYSCKTCTAPAYILTTGCCASCAAVCHKDHDLVLNYGNFFCDCGDGSLCQSPCKLMVTQLPKEPTKADLKNLGYCQYSLESTTDIQRLKDIMQNHQQNHFLVIRQKNHVMFPWVNHSSEKLCEDVRKVSKSRARSCEIDPRNEGATIYVWSDADKTYVDAGSYDSFIQ